MRDKEFFSYVLSLHLGKVKKGLNLSPKASNKSVHKDKKPLRSRPVIRLYEKDTVRQRRINIYL